MGQKTALGNLLKAIGNSGQGKVVPGWGAVPIMTVIGLLLLVFLVSIFVYVIFFVDGFGPPGGKARPRTQAKSQDHWHLHCRESWVDFSKFTW